MADLSAPRTPTTTERNRILLERVYAILRVAKKDIEEVKVPINVLDELVALDRDVSNAIAQIESIYRIHPDILNG